MSDEDTKIVQISGVANPTQRTLRMAEVLYGKGTALAMNSVIEDAMMIDGMARALDQAFNAGLSADGRLDLRESAMFLINLMKANQK